MSERDRILAVFEARRETPGTPYDAGNFLDYLRDQPKGTRAVYDSFAGLRRFNAFIDQVQMEFSVCLSVKDREAHYSLDRFVARIAELRNSPRSSLASLRQRMKSGIEWNIIVVSNLCLAIPAIALRHAPVVLAAILAAAVALNSFWFWFYRREKRYAARLHQRILAASRDDP